MKLIHLHVTNNTGNPLIIHFAGPVEVPPGRWCLGTGEEPHCQPKGKP